MDIKFNTIELKRLLRKAKEVMNPKLKDNHNDYMEFVHENDKIFVYLSNGKIAIKTQIYYKSIQDNFKNFKFKLTFLELKEIIDNNKDIETIINESYISKGSVYYRTSKNNICIYSNIYDLFNNEAFKHIDFMDINIQYEQLKEIVDNAKGTKCNIDIINKQYIDDVQINKNFIINSKVQYNEILTSLTFKTKNLKVILDNLNKKDCISIKYNVNSNKRFYVVIKDTKQEFIIFQN